MLQARVYLVPDRAPRLTIDAPGTVRRDGYAHPVTIDNLSSSGIHLSADFELEIDEIVATGIPGIGIHLARVIRRSPSGYGCEFLTAIAHEEVARAASFTIVATASSAPEAVPALPVAASRGRMGFLPPAVVAIVWTALTALAIAAIGWA